MHAGRMPSGIRTSSSKAFPGPSVDDDRILAIRAGWSLSNRRTEFSTPHKPRSSMQTWKNSCPIAEGGVEEGQDGSKANLLRPVAQHPLPEQLAVEDSTEPTANVRLGETPERAENEPILLQQPETRPISHEKLVIEVKGIYAGLVMVEAKCIDVDERCSEAAQEIVPTRRACLSNEQWQSLIALHKSLLQEHHDFFIASQHPSATSALSGLATKYSMPARMWRHGIHAFLELLRHRLPESLEHMVAFIYIAYTLMALLYETVTTFEDTWIECLGDLRRYRETVEDEDSLDHERWSSVTRCWYDKAADRAPDVGRLNHGWAILAPPDSLEQLNLYVRALWISSSHWCRSSCSKWVRLRESLSPSVTGLRPAHVLASFILIQPTTARTIPESTSSTEIASNLAIAISSLSCLPYVIFLAANLSVASYIASSRDPISVWGTMMSVWAFGWWVIRADPHTTLWDCGMVFALWITSVLCYGQATFRKYRIPRSTMLAVIFGALFLDVATVSMIGSVETSTTQSDLLLSLSLPFTTLTLAAITYLLAKIYTSPAHLHGHQVQDWVQVGRHDMQQEPHTPRQYVYQPVTERYRLCAELPATTAGSH